MIRISVIYVLFLLLASKCSVSDNKSAIGDQENTKVTEGGKGLQGYISYTLPEVPDGYGAGISFYSAVWPLIDKPLANFQIGLPGTWIIPDNRDVTFPLCPEGTLARNWEPRGPSWASVFQTVEGGIGYWRGNRFRYASPKFSMNGVPSCYDYEVASPGWPFFHSSTPLADNKMGIAQLSNRLLVPPDGITFQGKPNGQFLGYAWMVLPLMDARSDNLPRGDQSWTLFLNSTNFKGPVAYYVAETWTKIAKDYPEVTGHTLDTRPGIAGSGAMEINTVPQFEQKTSSDSIFTKIPALNFPLDEQGKSILVQDVRLYSKESLFRPFENWKNTNSKHTGTFEKKGLFQPVLSAKKTNFRQNNEPINGINDMLIADIFSDNQFGITWKNNKTGVAGKFPQYFVRTDNKERTPIAESKVPKELRSKEFALAKIGDPYTSPKTGAWAMPGPASKEMEITIADGSTVTYCWYRFIDQPSLQQFNWSREEKAKLQALIEKMHTSWLIDNEYMEPLSKGELVSLDEALIITPPKEYEVGYVPIVTGQK